MCRSLEVVEDTRHRMEGRNSHRTSLEGIRRSLWSVELSRLAEGTVQWIDSVAHYAHRSAATAIEVEERHLLQYASCLAEDLMEEA